MSMLGAAPCAINKVQSRSLVYLAEHRAHVRPNQRATGFGRNKKGVAIACGPWDPVSNECKEMLLCLSRTAEALDLATM
jgi:hypothetical protein